VERELDGGLCCRTGTRWGFVLSNGNWMGVCVVGRELGGGLCNRTGTG
jgi:hypothetical protein